LAGDSVMFDALLIITAFSLVIWVLWWQLRDPESCGPQRPVQEMPAFCAWCIYRDGGPVRQPEEPHSRPGVRAGVLRGCAVRSAGGGAVEGAITRETTCLGL
jgi:hypothetical protein